MAFSSFSAAQTFSDFVNHIASLPDTSAQNAAIDSFLTANTDNFPYVEGDTAHFIYRGFGSSMKLAGDFNGWQPLWEMNQIPNTNFFYYSKVFEQNARLDYKMVRNGGEWILDPLNPNLIYGGYGANSELAMPEYVQPWEIRWNPAIPHGEFFDSTLYSQELGQNRSIRILLPPGYDPSKPDGYPSVYFQDGFEYFSLGSARLIIDNILDSNKIEPVIAVFVEPENRNDEYAGGKRFDYTDFFVNELVPFIDANFNTDTRAERRLVLGDSFGGNISALISHEHPDIFANCGLHSAAFWPNSFEVYDIIVNNPPTGIKYFAVWGTYEGLFQNMREFRDSLISQGYEHDWLELPEGHSWGLWRANIDNMLTYFFPADPASVKEPPLLPETHLLSQNYPNPFNPATIIEYKIKEAGEIALVLYDAAGSEVDVLDYGYRAPGNYRVRLNARDYNLASGVYFYTLYTDKHFESRKMIFVK